jgi:hypothetical protein
VIRGSIEVRVWGEFGTDVEARVGGEVNAGDEFRDAGKEADWDNGELAGGGTLGRRKKERGRKIFDFGFVGAVEDLEQGDD